ncbi:3-deoxy-D-manno-octulosonic acid transferase [Beijerinckiaceae bacterium]|nr:3-deoxy-D-manno-octulosonic acid transferase [Beijerinckiaceae bacterium]
MKASPLLAMYRWASAGFGLIGPLVVYWRAKLGHEDFARRRERLGWPGLPRPKGGLALVHAASAVEAQSLTPLLEKLGTLGFGTLISTGRGVPSRLRDSRSPPTTLHQFAPLDTPQFMSRFLDHWQPDIILIAEAALLPNMIVEASRRGIPLVLVDARLSEGSFAFLRKFSAFVGPLMRRFDVCLTQTETDATWFAKLGAQKVQVVGRLKYDLVPLPADQPSLARLMARIGTRPVWVADGVYPGEEEIALVAHRRLVRQFPDLLSVIVPHSPKRGFEITQAAAKMGLAVGLGDRDSGSLPEIFIAPTSGEAGLFYRIAGVIFAGKSLAFGGGRNPVEAAKLGCAVLHGPDVEDFEEIYAALDRVGGGAMISDADSLAAQLALLLSDNTKLRAMARAAAQTAETFGGASGRILRAIEYVTTETPTTHRAIS